MLLISFIDVTFEGYLSMKNKFYIFAKHACYKEICMKVIWIVMLAAISIEIFAQENPNKKYTIEFEWQKTIAHKESKNIKDYFLLLPSEIINCEGAMMNEYSTKQQREGSISKLDLKNGYLQFHRTGQLVLFKDRINKKDIIAVQSGRCGAGNTCGAYNTLMEFHNEQWMFRIDLLPDGKLIEELYYDDNSCPYFDLPQFGTTILIRNELKEGSVITKYKWTKQRFENSKP